MGRFDALTQLEHKPEMKEATEKTVSPAPQTKPVNENASLLANQQTSKLLNQQTSLSAYQQTSKPVNQQTSKPALTTKEKKKYGTYLREDSILEIQIHAAQARKKDHEFLQDIVDAYFENLKR